MCGIFCAISRSHAVWPSRSLQTRLDSRGPDSSGRHEHFVASSNLHVTFHSTVLAMRGDTVVQQPLRADNDAGTLCWNGEAWIIAGITTVGDNDTQKVFQQLLDATSGAPARTSALLDSTEYAASRSGIVVECLSQVAGPYAFVFHDSANDMLYFGRDFLGRRSLLTKPTDDGSLLISSVADGNATVGWSEVEADGVYCIDLRGNQEGLGVHASGWHYRPELLSRAPYVLAGRDNERAMDSVGLTSQQPSMSLRLIGR